MEAGRGVELSVSPLYSLIKKENLGEPHALLTGGERYFSPRFAAAAERVLQEELAAAGLRDRRAYLDFVDLVGVVQQSTTEYYGWVAGVEDDYGVLVASLGRHAVSVVRSGDTVRFAPCPADRMVQSLVGLLPVVSVARGEIISVSHDDFHTRVPGSVLARTTTTRADAARRLDELLAARRVSVTKLYAAKRDADGIRQRSERWVTVLDLVDGRWVLTVRQSRQGRCIRAVPGAGQVLNSGLRELAHSIR